MSDQPHNRPTEPGWYRARAMGIRWVPVEVVKWGNDGLRYFAFGIRGARPVDDAAVEWGQRITMPDERTTEKDER